MTRIEKYKDFKATFEGQRGKRIMADLAQFCCYNASTIVTIDHKVDTNHMMMQEGKRQVYLYILANLVEPKEIKIPEEKGEFD